MKKEQLKEIEENSKSAYDYMKKVENKYLKKKIKKKKLADEKKFLKEFEENHTEADVEYLLNDIQQKKNYRVLFTNSFFGITVPMYAALIASLAVFIVALLTFVGNISEQLIQLKLENDESNIDDVLSLFNEVNSQLINYFGIGSLLLFVTLLIIQLIRFWPVEKKKRYIGWLKTVKEFKEQKELKEIKELMKTTK